MSDAASHRRQQLWLAAWYEGRWWLWLLWPLSLLFRGLAALRRRILQGRAVRLPVPVVVVGNISLGGTGKTPMIIAAVAYLQSLGLRPGIVSRGYGGQAPHYPYEVAADSPVAHCGDEPLLLAQACQCPVAVDRDRVAAARWLVATRGCDIILSDDGLQHYRLARDLEIVLLDGSRGLGNGLCLPAGPLREPPQRLLQTDCVVTNGPLQQSLPVAATAQETSLRAVAWCNLASGERLDLAVRPWPFETPAGTIPAITGIGNPQRFFDSLAQLGLTVEGRAFPDHHAFVASDLAFARGGPLLMTAKDAVKCQAFAEPAWWYLEVAMTLPPALQQQLQRLARDAAGVPDQLQ